MRISEEQFGFVKGKSTSDAIFALRQLQERYREGQPRIRFQPFPVCHHDGLTDGNIRKKATWQMMFADDVVLCAREKDVRELELEQWREALEKRGLKGSRAKTDYMSLNGRPLGSVKMQ